MRGRSSIRHGPKGSRGLLRDWGARENEHLIGKISTHLIFTRFRPLPSDLQISSNLTLRPPNLTKSHPQTSRSYQISPSDLQMSSPKGSKGLLRDWGARENEHLIGEISSGISSEKWCSPPPSGDEVRSVRAAEFGHVLAHHVSHSCPRPWWEG